MDAKEIAAWEAFLKDEAPRLLARAQRHRLEFKDLWEGQDEAAIGRVLRCHLLVEHYLTRFLQAANPGLGDTDVARLSFWQKLRLATGSGVLKRGPVDLYSPGIEALNTVRNRMTHRLRSELDPADIKPMAEMVKMYAEAMKEPVPEGIAMAETFTRMICEVLAAFEGGIIETTPKGGLVVYLEWLKDQVDPAKRST